MGTTIVARTAIVGIRRVFARRRGEFLLADGTPAGWVHTDWVLIDARGALTRIPAIFAEVVRRNRADGPVGRIPLPPTPPDAGHRRFAVRPHELDPMDHANNAVYLDWLEESIIDAPAEAAAAAQAATSALPRRYRMEYALAAEARSELDGAAWRDGGGLELSAGRRRRRHRIGSGPAWRPERPRAGLAARTGRRNR